MHGWFEFHMKKGAGVGGVGSTPFCPTLDLMVICKKQVIESGTP